jgi:predicted membrane-bound spermidine synthase
MTVATEPPPITTRPAGKSRAGLLFPLFFLSGFAAILYQVVWQRTLFAVVGINVEAVTLIVTTFIFGLGLGSLLGGRLSRGTPGQLVRRFASIELAIGMFGLVSLPLMRHVGEWTTSLTPFATGLVTFGVLVLPTLGMGATLPILVADHVRRSGNVGTAVGGLYFVNTLGSAVAALAASYALMRALGQSGVIWGAATCNIVVAATVWFMLRDKERP